MKTKNGVRLWTLLMAWVVLLGALTACNEKKPDDDASDDLPQLESNQVAQVEFTAMYYRPDLDSDIVQIQDGKTVHRILALFNHVEFSPLDADDMKEVYLEMAVGQYILLEGGATVYVSDAGRVMLTASGAESCVSDFGVVDPQALRTIAAEDSAARSN